MKKAGLVYIILASVLWGTSGIFVEYLAPYGVTSLQMTYVRGLVAFACMGIFVLSSVRNIIKTNFRELILFAGSGFSFFLTATCYFRSMQLTSVSTAVVLMYTAPIFVMIYSVAFLGEKLNTTKSISVIGMIVGCALTSGVIGNFRNDPLGISIGFLSGISYAAYNIITKIEMQKGINPIKANFYCFLFSTIVGTVFSKPDELIGCIGQNPPVVISLCIGLGVLTCVLPYFLYTLSLRDISAGTASALGILEPMAATILSVLILSERLSVYSIMGIVFILISVFFLSKEKR